MIENGMVSLQNAMDLHVHPGPSVFARLFDDIQMAEAAAAAGLKAVAIKNHFESTVGRAYLTGKIVPQIKVFGGIVLNTWTGGLNPIGVESNILLGGKFVWMPTTTSANHIQSFKGGSYTSASGRITGPITRRWSPRLSSEKGITILEDKALKEEVKQIVQLVAEYDVVLGSSHLSKEEIFALVRYANEMGVRKMVVNHPYWRLPNLSIEEVKELAGMGAFVELVAICHISDNPVPIELVKNTIDLLGADRLFISSDCGAAMFPYSTEAIRLMAQWLYQSGVTEDQLKTMMCEVPRFLVGM